MKELDETDPAFGQAPGKQAIRSKRTGVFASSP